MGDFNMFESPADQLGGVDSSLVGREWGTWDQLARKLHLKDSFSLVRGHLRFSWDSMRLHRHNPTNASNTVSTSSVSRLDRIYVVESRHGPRLYCTSTILPGFAFLDHAPVWAEIMFSDTQNRPTRFQMNTSHFPNPEYKERIKLMWERGNTQGLECGWTPFRTLNRCIKEAGQINRCWGKRKAAEKGSSSLRCYRTGLEGRNWLWRPHQMTTLAKWRC